MKTSTDGPTILTGREMMFLNSIKNLYFWKSVSDNKGKMWRTEKDFIEQNKDKDKEWLVYPVICGGKEKIYFYCKEKKV